MKKLITITLVIVTVVTLFNLAGKAVETTIADSTAKATATAAMLNN